MSYEQERAIAEAALGFELPLEVADTLIDSLAEFIATFNQQFVLGLLDRAADADRYETALADMRSIGGVN